MWEAVAGWIGRWFAAAQPQRADFECVVKQWEGLVSRLTARIDEAAKEDARYRDFVLRRFKELEDENETCRRERSADLQRIFELEAQVGELKTTIEALRRAESLRADPAFQARTVGQNKMLLEAPKPPEGP